MSMSGETLATILPDIKWWIHCISHDIIRLVDPCELKEIHPKSLDPNSGDIDCKTGNKERADFWSRSLTHQASFIWENFFAITSGYVVSIIGYTHDKPLKEELDTPFTLETSYLYAFLSINIAVERTPELCEIYPNGILHLSHVTSGTTFDIKDNIEKVVSMQHSIDSLPPMLQDKLFVVYPLFTILSMMRNDLNRHWVKINPKVFERTAHLMDLINANMLVCSFPNQRRQLLIIIALVSSQEELQIEGNDDHTYIVLNYDLFKGLVPYLFPPLIDQGHFDSLQSLFNSFSKHNKEDPYHPSQ